MRIFADRHTAQNLCSGADDDIVLNRQLGVFFADVGPADGRALIDCAIVADLHGIADDDTHAVIDKDAPPDFGSRVDVHTGKKAP